MLLMVHLAGCATMPVMPCTTQVTVTLDTPERVNGLCHHYESKDTDPRFDNGVPIRQEDKIGGCTVEAGKHVVTDYDPETLWHEFKHVWARRCR